jgi:hypothetical protein
MPPSLPAAAHCYWAAPARRRRSICPERRDVRGEVVHAPEVTEPEEVEGQLHSDVHVSVAAYPPRGALVEEEARELSHRVEDVGDAQRLDAELVAACLEGGVPDPWPAE